MGPRKSSASFGTERDVSFELLEQGKGSERTRMTSISDNGWTGPTGKLPPKSLNLVSLTSRVRWMFWTALATIVIIIGLSILASKIVQFLPYTDGIILNSPVSCDLSVKGGGFQGAFSINLRGATHLTFSEAKAIDVIWQLFAGAGGRFLMAWIAYKMFMDGVTRLMEQTPMPYQLYASLTFSMNSLFATYYASKAVFQLKGWRIKFFMAWFSLSTIYMLGFPTLISATAGYLTPSTAGFNMTDGTFLTADSPQLKSCYNLSAGALVGYQNNTIIPGPPVSQFDVVDPSITWASTNATDALASLLAAVPGIKTQYPVFVDLWNATQLRGEKIYDDTNTSEALPGQWLSNYTTNITIHNHTYVFHNYDFVEDGAVIDAYCYDNNTIENLPKLAQCLPESYFVWGFSSLLVYIVISLQIVWFFGMYIVWLDANINSTLCQHGRKVRGHFRAAADISEAAREVLGKQTCAYTDEELARELDKQPGVRYYTENVGSGDIAHVGLSSRRLGPVLVDGYKLYGRYDKDR